MRIEKANSRHYRSSRAASRAEAEPASPPKYWSLAWTHGFAVIAIIVVCVAISALFTFSARPVYRGRASLELQIPTLASNPAGEGVAGPVSGQSFESYLDTQIGILQSDTLIRRVIAKLHLAEQLSNYRPPKLAALRERYLSLVWGSAGTSEDVFETAARNLLVRQSRLNNLIEVNYDANNPALAANFVNTLVEEYQQQNLETRWQASQNASSWFASHLDDLRKQLEASESALEEYSRANGLLQGSDPDKSSVARERLHQLQEDLSRAQAERIGKQSQLEMSDASSPDSVPQIVDSAATKDYELKIADLERQLVEYQQIYKPTNPKVATLQAQIVSLRSALNRHRSSLLARVSNDYKASLRNEELLAAEYKAQTRLVTDQDAKMIRYETLKHDVATNRATYESLLQRVKESGMSTALQATNIRIVDAAIPPLKPYKPNHVINIGGGLLAGLILSLTFVAVRQRSDRRVYGPGVIQQYLTTRELGVIPSDHQGERRRLSQMIGFNGIKSSGPRAWLGDPDSPLSTSFRSVMTSITFATRFRSRARFALITSPGPDEGKTTVASNLAAAFAATGQRVLLVDADLRRPHIHRVFDLPESPGLWDLAEELHLKGPEGVQLDRFIKPTKVPDLFVLTSGTNPPGAPNLLHNLHFDGVFAALRQGFDTVLIDAPPLLSVPEVRVMARLTDGVVLVIRAGATHVDAAIAAEDYIREDGGTMIGTILNDAPHSLIPYYNGYARTAQ